MSKPEPGSKGVPSPYQGAGFSILGDSISTLAGWIPDGWRVHYGDERRIGGIAHPHDTWWGQVIEHFGGHLVANSSFSGSTVEGRGFPAGDSAERIRALAGPDGELPDVVIAFMGVNDYGWGGASYQMLGGNPSAPVCSEAFGGSKDVAPTHPGVFSNPKRVAPVVGAAPLDRFRAAYESMLGRIGELVPEAEVWCVTLAPGTVPGNPNVCWKYRIHGVDLDDYNNAIRDAAVRAGARVADVRAFGVAYDAVDGLHPSAQGMRQIAAMAVAQMEGSPADPGLLPELQGAQRAVRRCPKESCCGCALADEDPSSWTVWCSGPIW